MLFASDYSFVYFIPVILLISTISHLDSIYSISSTRYMCMLLFMIFHLILDSLSFVSFNSNEYVNSEYHSSGFHCNAWNYKKDSLIFFIFIIKGFRTIVLIFIVISTMFRPICSPAFFRCLSNSGTLTELRTTSFI